VTLVTLAPFAAGRGAATGLDAILGSRQAVSGSRIGGGTDLGAMIDGDDGTYFIIEGGTSGGEYYVTPVWGDFVLPADAGTPTAVAIRVRAVTPAFSYGNDPGAYRDWQTFFTDTSWGYFGTLQGGDTNLTSLELLSQADFADFDYWYGIVSPTDHSDNGDWFEFSKNGSTGTSVQAALTGTGLRVTVFMDSWNEVDANFKWAYLTSLELLVETAGAAPTGTLHVPPLRLHPRSDGCGMSSAQRVWPRPPTASSGRVGPGSLI